jgi:hypothetical protein
MKNTLKFALTAVLFAAAPLANAEAIDCVKVSTTVKSAVAADSDKVLEIVAKEIAANESCACEVVKAAIIASEASKELVAKIVETGILEAPSKLRIIEQCAIAVAPDAIKNVQNVVEKYDKAGGEGYSEKGGLDSAKDGGSADSAVAGGNPLDFPGGDEGDLVGPRPGGFAVLPPILPPGGPVAPPIVTPPSASEVGSSATN